MAVLLSGPATVGVTTKVTVALLTTERLPQITKDRARAGATTLTWGYRNKIHACRQGVCQSHTRRVIGSVVGYGYGIGQVLANLDRVGRVGVVYRNIGSRKPGVGVGVPDGVGVGMGRELE